MWPPHQSKTSPSKKKKIKNCMLNNYCLLKRIKFDRRLHSAECCQHHSRRGSRSLVADAKPQDHQHWSSIVGPPVEICVPTSGESLLASGRLI